MPNWCEEPDWSQDNEEDEDFVANRKKRGVLGTPRGLKEPEYWNGQPVSRMDSDHIMNAILFCERKYVDARENFFKAHEEGKLFYFSSVFDMFPDYRHLRNEWERRKKE